MVIKVRETTMYERNKFDYGGTRDTPSRRHPSSDNRPRERSSSPKGWRESNDYRADYFSRNHGIGGFAYICSQCFKPMYRKDKIQVDHIIPPSRFAIKRSRGGEVTSNSIVARFLNHSFNCAAICPDCNRRKSNKMDIRIAKGYAMKVLEIGFTLAQITISIPFLAIAYGTHLVHKVFTLFRGR